MGKKKKKLEDVLPISEEETTKVVTAYKSVIDSDKEFSLEIDPENKYGFNDIQRKFIKSYVNYRNLSAVALLCDISTELSREYYFNNDIQNEISRIDRALHHRQFTSNILKLDEIGGYLSSLITDDNVPLADRLTTNDKLKAISTLMEVIKLKSNSVVNPDLIINQEFNVDVKNLSIKTIKNLLNNLDKDSPNGSLTTEQIKYLENLSTEDTLKLLENMN